MKTCTDCGKPFDEWQQWAHPGAASARCEACYGVYTRRRQTTPAYRANAQARRRRAARRSLSQGPVTMTSLETSTHGR